MLKTLVSDTFVCENAIKPMVFHILGPVQILGGPMAFCECFCAYFCEYLPGGICRMIVPIKFGSLYMQCEQLCNIFELQALWGQVVSTLTFSTCLQRACGCSKVTPHAEQSAKNLRNLDILRGGAGYRADPTFRAEPTDGFSKYFPHCHPAVSADRRGGSFGDGLQNI